MPQETSIQSKAGSDVRHAEETHSGWHYRPQVDIVETQDELTIHLDVPGADPRGIDVHYEQGQLTLHAEVKQRQPESTCYLLREYGVASFHRTFQIGTVIDDKKITAACRNGVLTVHLPKSEAVKPRKIAVQSK